MNSRKDTSSPLVDWLMTAHLIRLQLQGHHVLGTSPLAIHPNMRGQGLRPLLKWDKQLLLLLQQGVGLFLATVLRKIRWRWITQRGFALRVMRCFYRVPFIAASTSSCFSPFCSSFPFLIWGLLAFGSDLDEMNSWAKWSPTKLVLTRDMIESESFTISWKVEQAKYRKLKGHLYESWPTQEGNLEQS